MPAIIIKHRRSPSLAARLAYDYRQREGGVKISGRLRVGVITGDALTDARTMLTGSEVGRCECFSVITSMAVNHPDGEPRPEDWRLLSDAVERVIDAIKPGADYIASRHVNTGHGHIHARMANDDGHGRSIQIDQRALYDLKQRLTWNVSQEVTSSWVVGPLSRVVRRVWATMSVRRLAGFLRDGLIRLGRLGRTRASTVASIELCGSGSTPPRRVCLDRPVSLQLLARHSGLDLSPVLPSGSQLTPTTHTHHEHKKTEAHRRKPPHPGGERQTDRDLKRRGREARRRKCVAARHHRETQRRGNRRALDRAFAAREHPRLGTSSVSRGQLTPAGGQPRGPEQPTPVVVAIAVRERNRGAVSLVELRGTPGEITLGRHPGATERAGLLHAGGSQPEPTIQPVTPAVAAECCDDIIAVSDLGEASPYELDDLAPSSVGVSDGDNFVHLVAHAINRAEMSPAEVLADLMRGEAAVRADPAAYARRQQIIEEEVASVRRPCGIFPHPPQADAIQEVSPPETASPSGSMFVANWFEGSEDDSSARSDCYAEQTSDVSAATTHEEAEVSLDEDGQSPAEVPTLLFTEDSSEESDNVPDQGLGMGL